MMRHICFAFHVTLLLLSTNAWADAQKDLIQLQAEIDRLNDALNDPGRDASLELKRLIQDRSDFRALAERAFGDHCDGLLEDYEDTLEEPQQQALVEVCQERLAATVSTRVVEDALKHLADRRPTRLQLVAQDLSVSEGMLQMLALGDEIEIRSDLRFDGSRWKAVDLFYAGTSLSERLRDSCDDILDRGYSQPVLSARLLQQDYIVLEDFSTTDPGMIPRDWGPMRAKDQKKPKPYAVGQSNGRNYLAASDTGNSVILGKFVHWNPRKFPIMTWCWRANAIPPGANERINKLNDSAAGIYVIFSMNWLGVPRQIKYVWSSTLKEGTVDRRKKIFRPWFFVVESGEQNLGEWTFEQVDLLRDYQKVFGGVPKKRSVGLGVLTDANNTKSYAEAYYADLRVWTREALDQGRITDYCDCYETPVKAGANAPVEPSKVEPRERASGPSTRSEERQ